MGLTGYGKHPCEKQQSCSVLKCFCAYRSKAQVIGRLRKNNSGLDCLWLDTCQGPVMKERLIFGELASSKWFTTSPPWRYLKPDRPMLSCMLLPLRRCTPPKEPQAIMICLNRAHAISQSNPVQGLSELEGAKSWSRSAFYVQILADSVLCRPSP